MSFSQDVDRIINPQLYDSARGLLLFFGLDIILYGFPISKALFTAL